MSISHRVRFAALCPLPAVSARGPLEGRLGSARVTDAARDQLARSSIAKLLFHGRMYASAMMLSRPNVSVASARSSLSVR
jgi:hypothetical protein